MGAPAIGQARRVRKEIPVCGGELSWLLGLAGAEVGGHVDGGPAKWRKSLSREVCVHIWRRIQLLERPWHAPELARLTC